MMVSVNFILLYLIILIIKINCYVNYTGYSVYRVIPETIEQLIYLKSLEDKLTDQKNDDVGFWKGPRFINDTVDIMLSAKIQDEFQSKLRKENIQINIMINDVEK